jgi:hypothetical protein
MLQKAVKCAYSKHCTVQAVQNSNLKQLCNITAPERALIISSVYFAVITQISYEAIERLHFEAYLLQYN